MEQIKIDIVPVGVAPVAHASQFDNGRQIRFNLFNQGTPYTLTGAETVTMVVNGEEENITNTSDNYVIWDVAEEDCEKVGVIGCEIRIVLGSMLIGSKNFFLEVEMDPYDGKNIRIVTVGPADICTFETTLADPLQSVTVDIEATGGNGTPDNPNPVNGYTEANITRCGVNLFDKTADDATNGYKDNYYIAPDGIEQYQAAYAISEYIPLKGGVNITLTGAVGYNPSMAFYDLSKTLISASSYSGTDPCTKTTPNGTAFVRFSISKASIDTTQLEIGNQASSYHAYTGNAYAVSFGQTVYGGVLDVTRGKLHVTWLYFKGGWSQYNASNGYKAYSHLSLSPAKTTYGPGLSNMVNEFGSFSSDNMTKNIIQLPNALGQCFMALDENADPNDVEVAYELATPFDIDLTPEVISAVVGENNVFAGCGETTVKYLKAGG